MNFARHSQGRNSGAFTLIEIMVVIGIVALVLTIGVPAIFSSLKKDVLRQTVSDLIEACTEARAHAIISGLPTELVFQPHENNFHVGMAANDRPMEHVVDGEQIVGAGPSFSRSFPTELVLEMLSVNFQEMKDEDLARVRFFPNGTCDEFTIVVQWPQKQAYRKITLDIITSMAEVEVIR